MNKEQQPTCPMCVESLLIHIGPESKEEKFIFDWIQGVCNSCGADIIFTKIGKEEVLKRFSSRPESAWEMFRRLFDKYEWNFFDKIREKHFQRGDLGINVDYGHRYNQMLFAIDFIFRTGEQKAISIMQQIEEELRHE